MLESVEDACNKERNFSLVLGQQNRQTSGMSHCDRLCNRPTVLAMVGFLRWMVRMIWQFDFHHHFLWAASEQQDFTPWSSALQFSLTFGVSESSTFISYWYKSAVTWHLASGSTTQPFCCFSMAMELSSGHGMGWNPCLHCCSSSCHAAGAVGWRTSLACCHSSGRGQGSPCCSLSPVGCSSGMGRASTAPLWAASPRSRQLESSAGENTISIIGTVQLYQPSWQPGSIFCLNPHRGQIVSSCSLFQESPGSEQRDTSYRCSLAEPRQRGALPRGPWQCTGSPSHIAPSWIIWAKFPLWDFQAWL